MRISEHRATYIIINVIVSILLLSMLAFGVYYWIVISAMCSRYYEPEMVLPSSNGQYDLVVREWSCLGGAGADVYLRKTEQGEWYNSWMKLKIGTASGDDYYQPFSHGTYEVEWESDRVTIYYYRDLSVEDRNDPSTWLGVVTYELE